MATPPRGGGADLPLLSRSPDAYEPVELLSFQNQSTFSRNNNRMTSPSSIENPSTFTRNNNRVTSPGPIEASRNSSQGPDRSPQRNVSVVVSNDDVDEPDISMPRPPAPDPSTFSLDEERMNYNSATLGSRSFDNYYR